jgi:molybdopterin-biosynthesis enzyme MoeA-like protein
MAVIPEGSTPMVNEPGTAPGVRIESGPTVIFCLPGVPHEMKSIYSRSVHPEILRKIGRLFTTKIVMQLEGVFESTLTPDIAEAVRAHPSAYIKPHVELDLVVVAPDRPESESECSAMADFFAQRVAQAGGTVARRTITALHPRAQL